MKEFALAAYQDVRETIRALDSKANILLVATSLLLVVWLNDNMAIQTKLESTPWLFWFPLFLLFVEILTLLAAIYPRLGTPQGSPLWMVGSMSESDLIQELQGDNWIKLYRSEMIKLEKITKAKIKRIRWSVIILGIAAFLMLIAYSTTDPFWTSLVCNLSKS